MPGRLREDLFDLVHESIFARDLDGRIRSWNPASAELYGWATKQVLGQPAHKLLGTRHESPIASLERDLLQTGRWDGELTRKTAKGELRLVEARWSLRRDAAGAPLEIIEIGRDITARRAAEAAAKQTERRYTSLFQAMAASFWQLDFNPVGAMLKQLMKAGVTDVAGYFAANPDYVREMMRATLVVDVNDETVKLFGAGSRDAIGASVEPFWATSSTAVYAASVVAAISGRPNFVAETRFRRADGEEFHGHFTACFPDESVARGTLLVGVIDISERVKAQETVRRLQAEFAHSARVSMLGELTASIAHEVNQPLAAIATNGAASLRWMRRAEPDVDQALKLTERIVSDAQRAGDIISRIRTMAANRPADPEIMPINGVIEEAMLFLHHELQAHGVTPVLALGEALPDVCADRTQLQQVFVNLAVNAIQSMAHAGTARPEIRIASTTDGSGALRVVVADNGPGLGAPALAHLFDSFFTTKATGMGMGLPICRSILEAFGGTISARNAPDGGAVFTLTLPAAADSDA